MLILFAEDKPEDRIFLADYLRHQGHEVVEVFDAPQAIEALEEAEFDVVLLDIIMPDKNPDAGRHVLEFLTEREKGKGKGQKTPVILCTAWGNNGVAQALRKDFGEHVQDVLTKVFAAEQLVAAIGRVAKTD